jgi:hypothetical protein
VEANTRSAIGAGLAAAALGGMTQLADAEAWYRPLLWLATWLTFLLGVVMFCWPSFKEHIFPGFETQSPHEKDSIASAADKKRAFAKAKIDAYQQIQIAGKELGTRSIGTDYELSNWKSDYQRWLTKSEAKILMYGGHSQAGHFRRDPQMWVPSPFIRGYNGDHIASLTQMSIKLDCVTRLLENALDGY